MFLFVLFIFQPKDGNLFSQNKKLSLNSICKNKVVFRGNSNIYIYIYIYIHTHTFLLPSAAVSPTTAARINHHKRHNIPVPPILYRHRQENFNLHIPKGVDCLTGKVLWQLPYLTLP